MEKEAEKGIQLIGGVSDKDKNLGDMDVAFD